MGLLQSMTNMAQAMLSNCGYKLLLKEIEIKKEVEDMHVLVCEYCRSPENVDIYDSQRNTSPFICSSCYTIDAMEAYQNPRKISSYTCTTTTQTRLAYYMHFFYPDTIVSSQVI
jgi:hypothetical protein